MAIAARIVGDMLMGAVLAARDMAAKLCRAASLDGVHDLQLIKTDVARIGHPPGSTMGTEDIRDLQPWPAARQSIAMQSMRGGQREL